MDDISKWIETVSGLANVHGFPIYQHIKVNHAQPLQRPSQLDEPAAHAF